MAAHTTFPAWEVVAESPAALLIRDIGYGEGRPSITDGAAFVVLKLRERGQLQRGRRLFYADALGGFNEIIYEGTTFYRIAAVDRPRMMSLLGGTPHDDSHTTREADC